MRLDLVVATFRRQELLADTLRSVFAARRPPGLHVRVIVVNNDDDPRLSSLQPLLDSAPVPVLVLHEPRRGKSRALNLGLRASDADYIGLIDDDERLAPPWFEVAHDALAPGGLDFIGGPMIPLWPSPPPSWIPRRFAAVLGIVDNGHDRQPYTREFPGMLVGGNAVIRRKVLESIGGFSPELGPQEAHRLMSCEDEDVYERLLDAGARGEYVPALIVHHHVHPDRIRKAYYRSWCFWNGASKAVLDSRRPATVPTIGGVPRYLYGTAFRTIGSWLNACVLLRGPAARLEAELPVWQLAGQLYGRYKLCGRPEFQATRDQVARPVAAPRRP
jgi:GT2 family glycosyltransferase